MTYSHTNYQSPSPEAYTGSYDTIEFTAIATSPNLIDHEATIRVTDTVLYFIPQTYENPPVSKVRREVEVFIVDADDMSEEERKAFEDWCKKAGEEL